MSERINWKEMTEYEKKIKRREYMKKYYERKKKMIREKGRYISKKRGVVQGFTKQYGEFIVKFE